MMGYGYETESGDRISALIDMINGGGPGRSGDTFEGGGILSLLANAVARPYGSVRERPGHSPMGAERPMDVSPMMPRPVDDVRVDTLRAIEDPAATEVLRPEITTTPLDDVGEETGRSFTEADFDALRLAPPQLARMFDGIPVGSPLTPREEMILDALRASASFNPSVNPRRPVTRSEVVRPLDMETLRRLPDDMFNPGGRFHSLGDVTVGDRLYGRDLNLLRDSRM